MMSRLRMSPGISINQWAAEWEPLKHASCAGDLGRVKELAAKFEATDQPLQIALAMAACGNHVDVLRYLLERGTPMGPDALRLARTTEVFEAFMELGGWKINDPYKWWGGTIIVPIIELNDEKLLRWFLERGADPNVSDADCSNPASSCLAVAGTYASPPVVDVLLKHGAKLTPSTLHSVFNDHYSTNPRDRLDMMHHLVHNCGFDINGIGPLISKYPPKEGTALHAASHAGCMDGIRWLIENGADVLREGTGGLLPCAVSAVDNDVLHLVSLAETCERRYREGRVGDAWERRDGLGTFVRSDA